MSFEKRVFSIVFFGFIAALLIGGITVVSVNFSQVNDGSTLVVKTLPYVKMVPKAVYIPAGSKTKAKADISNAALTPKTKKPVVINI